ncbi:phage tail protein [Spirochaetia bacterium]|nr:phage tail protein [Spirochaetia bacterium]
MLPEFYWGKVVDNEDPEGLHRVRLSVQDEGKEELTRWIPVMSSFTGEETGVSLLPDINDQVLVTSVNDKGDKYVVIGSVWSDDIAPPETGENSGAELNQDGENSLKFIKSRAGSQLIFDDSEGAEKIQLLSPDGKSRLELLVADELFSLDTEKDLSMGAKGEIAIQAEKIMISSKKKVTISTEEYQVSAKKAFKINANKDMGIEGSGLSIN